MERAFKYLKGEYLKEKREQNLDSRSGSAATNRKEFPLYQSMQFLDKVRSENKKTTASNTFSSSNHQQHIITHASSTFNQFTASLPHPSNFIPSQQSEINEIIIPQHQQSQINEITTQPPQQSRIDEISSYPTSPIRKNTNNNENPISAHSQSPNGYTRVQIHTVSSADSVNKEINQPVSPVKTPPHIPNQSHSITLEIPYEPTHSPLPIQVVAPPLAPYEPQNDSSRIEFELIDNSTPYSEIVQVQIDAFQKIYKISLNNMSPSQKFDLVMDLTETCLKHNVNYEQN